MWGLFAVRWGNGSSSSVAGCRSCESILSQPAPFSAPSCSSASTLQQTDPTAPAGSWHLSSSPISPTAAGFFFRERLTAAHGQVLLLIQEKKANLPITEMLPKFVFEIQPLGKSLSKNEAVSSAVQGVGTGGPHFSITWKTVTVRTILVLCWKQSQAS